MINSGLGLPWKTTPGLTLNNPAFLTYFSYWKKQSAFLNLLKKSKCEYIVFENYNVIMNKTLDVIINQFNDQNEDEFQYTKAFLVGGFFNMKYLWMNNNYLKSPEELAELINNSLLNFSREKMHQRAFL